MRRRSDRVATLEAELERRLKELEQRESALKKISNVVMAKRAPATPAVDVDARLAELEHRESALKRISEVVERRRGELDAGMQERDARIAALEAELAIATGQAGRARGLETELSEAQLQLEEARAAHASLAAELEAALAQPPAEPVPPVVRRGLFRRAPAVDAGRVAELEAEAATLRARIAELERPAAVAPVEAETGAPLGLNTRPTLPQLEELAAEAARRGMPEAEEWSVYVGLLREHAGPNGTIPRDFDELMRDVFGAWD